MVTSFQDFVASRQVKQANYAKPKGNVRTQRAYVGQRQNNWVSEPSKKVHQPNPDYASFADSNEYKAFERERKQINDSYEQELAASTPVNSLYAGQRQARLNEKRISDAEEKWKKTYDDVITQRGIFDKSEEQSVKALSDGTLFNIETDSSASFILPDKERYISDFKSQQGHKRDDDPTKAGDAELEYIYYQQFLAQNNVSVAPQQDKIVDGEIVDDWERKTSALRDTAYKLLETVEIDGQPSQVYGFQKRDLEKELGPARMRTYAGVMANPMNEEFFPAATGAALGGLIPKVAETAGLITPGVSETISPWTAFTGENLGFGSGVFSNARHARWIAEDIYMPFKAARGIYRKVSQQFGKKNLRTQGQIDNAVSKAGANVPSKMLTELELLQAKQPALAYARASVGGTLPHADNVSLTPDGKMVVDKGNSSTTYTIETADDYFNAAGDALGMTPEIINHSKNISLPVLRAIADIFDVGVDSYVRAAVPQVRDASAGSLGKNVLGRTTFGDPSLPANANINLLNTGTFTKVASLVEFVKKSPGLDVNQFDSFVTLQHELAHIILEDVFTHAKYGNKFGDKKVIQLTESIKEQVVIRGKITGTPFSYKETNLIKSLSVDEVGDLLNGKVPAKFNQVVGEVAPGKPAPTVGDDLMELLHEAGADLFAKYTYDVGVGTKANAFAKPTTLDATVIWNSASQALAASWKLLSKEINPSSIEGIALAQTRPEQVVLNNFSSVLEEIAKSSGKSLTTDTVPVNRLAPEQGAMLAQAYARRNVDPDAVMAFARFLQQGKVPTIKIYGDQVLDDLAGNGSATSIITSSNSEFTEFGESLIKHDYYERILETISRKLDYSSDDYDFDAVEDLRRVIAVLGTSSATKVSSVWDMATPARNKLEDINEIIARNPTIPNLEKRLKETAFVNEANQPILFYTGVAVDYDTNFMHDQTNLFQNILGPGLYTTDFDQAALSYAVDRFLTASANAKRNTPEIGGARVQAFFPLVSKDKVMSFESVGLGDPVGTKFIDGVYSNPLHTSIKQVTLSSSAKKVRTEILKSPSSTSPKVNVLKEAGISLTRSAENVDLTVTDLSKLFGDQALQDSYKVFGDELDYLVREFSGPQGKDLERAEFLDMEVDPAVVGFEQVLAGYTEGLGSDTMSRIVAEASVTAVLKQARLEMDNLVLSKRIPTAEQTKALEILEEQDDLLQEAVLIYDSNFAKNYDYESLQNGQELFALTTEIQGSVSAPYLWQMAKSSSLLGLEPVARKTTKTGVKALLDSSGFQSGEELGTHLLHQKRNREYIRDIQKTYEAVAKADGNPVTAKKLALTNLNNRYAENGIEGLTEIGGGSQGGVPHRVMVLVGSDEVIRSNRAMVSVKTKTPSFGRTQPTVDPASLDQTDVEFLRYGRGYVAGPDLLPSKTITGNPILDGSVEFEVPRSNKRSPYRTVSQFEDTKIVKVTAKASKADLAKISASTSPQQTMRDLSAGRTPGSAQSLLRSQETYQFSRAGRGLPNQYGKPTREKVALVSIHLAERVSSKRAVRLGIPEQAGQDLWVMHTKSTGGAPELTLAERQAIADTIKKASHRFKGLAPRSANAKTGAPARGIKRRPKADIDIGATFNDAAGERVRRDPAAREPSSEEARSFYRKQNPKGGDIDDTISQGELESSATRFGRNLQDATSSKEVLGTKAVQDVIDKKIVASPRTVEQPARAAAEIVDLQNKTDQGLVLSSYHGIPNIIKGNLRPSQVDYSKHFGTIGPDGKPVWADIGKPIDKEVLDSVITDTTGVYRSSTGEILPAGKELIARNLLPRLKELIESDDYQKWIKVKQDAIDKGAKRSAAGGWKALDRKAKAKTGSVTYDKEVMGSRGQNKTPPSGYVPIEMHPIEVEALLDFGQAEYLRLNPKKIESSKDYRDAIQKVLGVETPRLGSPAQVQMAKATGGRLGETAGTTRLATSPVITPHEVNLIWTALGLDTAARSVTPKSKLQILRDLLVQVMNSPRVLLLSIDWGAIWNQGGLFVPGEVIKPLTTRRSLGALAKGNVKEFATGPDTQFHRSMGNSLLGMLSEGNYRSQMESVQGDANYDYLTEKAQVFISDLNGPLNQREEAFIGNVFNSIGNVFPEFITQNKAFQKSVATVKAVPGAKPIGATAKGAVKVVGYPFKAGERFHNLFLNKLRYDLVNDFYKGLDPNMPSHQMDKAVKSYANFVNKGTGRGDLGKLNDIAPELAAVLLAPRWMASRFQVPYTVAKVFGQESLAMVGKTFPKVLDAKGLDNGEALKSAQTYAKETGNSVTVTPSGYKVGGYKGGHVSKQMSQNLVRTFGVVGGIVTLLSLNGFKTETDWRKTNYMKSSRGEVNIDLTMGLGSVWRFIARLTYGKATGKEVSNMGEEYEADLARQINGFVTNKLSPMGSSAKGLVTEENFYGEENTGFRAFTPGQSTDAEDFYPLMVQQIQDVVDSNESNATKALLGIGAASGLNVSIYPDKDDLANDLAGIPYKELYGYEQKYINRMYYEGTEFVPSEYIQKSYGLELDLYEFVETIMAGNNKKGEKAQLIYRQMDIEDHRMHGLRLGFFGDDREVDEELDPLKQAQNDYYEMLGEVYEPMSLASRTNDEIDKIKENFLSKLTSKQQDYILANKTNFMVPSSIFQLTKNVTSANSTLLKIEALKAKDRKERQAKGLPLLADNMPRYDVNSGGDFYAVAKAVNDSNAARGRLSEGRFVVPSPEEQIELTRSIIAR
jgi:hypothetical protein